MEDGLTGSITREHAKFFFDKIKKGEIDKTEFESLKLPRERMF